MPTRVLIIGNSGAGKSSYARRLAGSPTVVHLDLDGIVWEPGQIAVQRPMDQVLAELDAFIAAHTEWIIEGCYGELVERALGYCTQLVFLNPGLAACLRHNASRPWEPHKYASKAEQDTMLAPLQEWVASYYVRDDAWSYTAHRRLFDGFAGNKLELTEPIAPLD